MHLGGEGEWDVDALKSMDSARFSLYEVATERVVAGRRDTTVKHRNQ